MRDFILVTAEDVDRLKDLPEQMGELQPPNPNGKYKTRHFYEVVIDGVDADVMDYYKRRCQEKDK